MKKILYIVMLVLMALPAVAQDTPNVEAVMDEFLAKLSRYTMSSAFAITVTEGRSAPQVLNGHIHMRGERFTFSAMSIQCAFDGKTLYTYDADTEELSLSTPTKDELVEANPLLFAKELRKSSVLRMGKSKNPKRYVIELLPGDKAGTAQRITITLDKATLLPLEITVKEARQTTTLRFSKPKFLTTVPSFVLQKDGAYVNDLR